MNLNVQNTTLVFQAHALRKRYPYSRLAKGLARQLGRHRIRVNCVSPGSVAGTRLLANARGYPLTRAESLAISARLPLARLTSAEEVAQGVLYLCGTGGCSITGTNLVIDAGESLRTD